MIEPVTIEDLLKKIGETKPESDLAKIRAAYEFAAKAHQGQKRDSGEDFIQHPLEVAAIVYELGMDTTSIIAALLHDVVEDTEVDIEQIKKEVWFRSSDAG